MTGFSYPKRSLQFLLLFVHISLHLISGLLIDPASPKDANKAVSYDASSDLNIGLKVVIICLGVLAIVAFTVLLFRIWQKKKREEQHDRLLKLFEDDDDDEIEVELGKRD